MRNKHVENKFRIFNVNNSHSSIAITFLSHIHTGEIKYCKQNASHTKKYNMVTVMTSYVGWNTKYSTGNRENLEIIFVGNMIKQLSIKDTSATRKSPICLL